MAKKRGAPAPDDVRSARILVSNIALVATVSSFVVVAVRALVVARLDAPTAVAVVRTSGPVNVFVGTMTAGISTWIAAAGLLYALARGGRAPETPGRHVADLMVLFLSSTILVGIAPWGWSLVWITLGVLLMSPRLGWELVPVRILATPVLAVTMLPFMGLLVSSQVWLPQERLELRDGTLVLGFVLEDEGSWMSILEERDRRVRIVEEGEIVERGLCRGSEDRQSETSLVYLAMEVFGDGDPQPVYPPCGKVG